MRRPAYALANGRRAVYILATKWADASTLSVINRIKAALPKMKDAMGKDGEGIDVRFEFDQSPYVTRAVAGVVTEGILGAGLVGLMIVLFLRDWRSALVVVLNIPLALMSAVFALWLTGQTVNLMTLGGLALSIGILVDEATVEIENIRRHMDRGKRAAQAVLDGAAETNLPRFLAMLCILAVFVTSFFMQGAADAFRAPVVSGRICDDFVVFIVEHVRARDVRVAAKTRAREARRFIGNTGRPRGRNVGACHADAVDQMG